jgi:transcriptional regulator with XRE-family HTH domain
VNEDRQLSQNSVYGGFAENLHRLVTGRGTITQACVGMNINRQQFNKYLNGSVLPNEATMKKLLTYFAVELQELFQDQNSVSLHSNKVLIAIPGMTNYFQKTLEKISVESAECKLRSGLYLGYAPWRPDEKYCMRSVVVMRRIDGIMYFTRLVRINEYGSKFKKYSSRIQQGIVTQCKNLVTLIGVEPKHDRSKTILSFVWDNVQPNACMSGLVSTHSPTGLPISARVILHYQGSLLDWRQNYRESGLIPAGDTSIRADAAAIIARYFNPKSAVLESVDLQEDWRRLTSN